MRLKMLYALKSPRKVLNQSEFSDLKKSVLPSSMTSCIFYCSTASMKLESLASPSS
jgi:hypothetical protein